MSSIVATYPVLNENLRNRFRYTIQEDYSFSYRKNSQEYPLICDEMGDGSINHKLSDNTGEWDPDRDNLIVRRKCAIRAAETLFGPGGVVCSNAVIGVAVVWTSGDSKQRGAIEIGKVVRSDQESICTLDYNFPNAELRGEVDFTTILYIRESGTPTREERYLANVSGTILGEMDHYQLQIDGNGSVFPIFEVSESGQPLWYVKCNWDDLMYDQFSDTVEININTAHRSYIYLNKNSKKYDPQLMIEIMSNALEIIITRAKSDPSWQQIMQGIGYQHGSVAEAVNYFVNALDWDVSTPEGMAISIRKFFDSREIG